MLMGEKRKSFPLVRSVRIALKKVSKVFSHFKMKIRWQDEYMHKPMLYSVCSLVSTVIYLNTIAIHPIIVFIVDAQYRVKGE